MAPVWHPDDGQLPSVVHVAPFHLQGMKLLGGPELTAPFDQRPTNGEFRLPPHPPGKSPAMMAAHQATGLMATGLDVLP